VHSFNDRWQVITDANLDILRRFDAHGIRLASPMQVTVNANGNGSALPADDQVMLNKVEVASINQVDGLSTPPTVPS
jgi:hypothetical protein